MTVSALTVIRFVILRLDHVLVAVVHGGRRLGLIAKGVLALVDGHELFLGAIMSLLH